MADEIKLPEGVWHRVQAYDQTKNPAMQVEIVTCAAICLRVPAGYKYVHEKGCFVKIQDPPTLDLRDLVKKGKEPSDERPNLVT